MYGLLSSILLAATHHVRGGSRHKINAGSLAALLAISAAFPTAAALGAAPPAVAPALASGGKVAAGRDTESIHIPFSTLGATQGLNLRGLEDLRSINIGVRLDRVVTAARLRLTYTYSPALVFAMSHLKVAFNGEDVAVRPFERERAGQAVTEEIVLDPHLFTDYSELQFRLIAHYTLEHCENPGNSSLWADISPTSELILDEAPVRLPRDLALLPAPFFDRRDSSRLTLPFVLPATAGNQTLRSAAVIASWFGALADYRKARFPAGFTLPADDHAVVLGVVNALPRGLALPPIDGATLLVMDNPAAPGKELLVVTGRNDAEVEQASNALVLGKGALSGPLAKLAQVDLGPPRKPYDAPRWVPLDRPVQFKELVDRPEQLQTVGTGQGPIRVDLRLPADLYSWGGDGAHVELKYRYTAPSIQNNSALAIELNDHLLKSYRLRPAGPGESGTHQQSAVLNPSADRWTTAVEVPSFGVSGTNQLQFRFNLDSEDAAVCAGTSLNPARAAVDPDSTIDFRQFVHYTAMPDLTHFANSGFPFTRYADLAQTVIILPEHPSAPELEALLTLAGHMGQWTGFPALRVSVARPAQVQTLADKDVLAISASGSSPLLDRWHKSLPLMAGSRPADPVRASLAAGRRLAGGIRPVSIEPGDTQPIPAAALLAFQSPVTEGRSVVALASGSEQGLADLLDIFEKPSLIGGIHGDLVLVRRGLLQSRRVAETYFVGDIPWHARVRGMANRHPIMLGAASILAGLLLAITTFNALHRVAARRRGVR